MSDKPLVLNEKTTVPLVGVFVALPTLVGAIVWLTSVDSKASASQQQLEELRPIVAQINERTIRIEEQLKRFARQQEKGR